MPLEIDDEYWDLDRPQDSYPLLEQQPTDKPAAIAYFVHNAQLSVILGTGAQTMVSLFACVCMRAARLTTRPVLD